MLIGTSPIEQPKWTETRVELLTKLVSEGCSGSQIAAELGGITRNAVIGKIHRLGLLGPKSREHAEPKPKPWAEADVHERTWQRWKAKEKNGGYRRVASAPGHGFAPASIGREATDLKQEINNNPVTLLELQVHHCRWPHNRDGEPMMYCGADSVLGFPYCPRHYHMAYVASKSVNRTYWNDSGRGPGIVRRYVKNGGRRAA
jgi:GcrA cell cycle regulator